MFCDGPGKITPKEPRPGIRHEPVPFPSMNSPATRHAFAAMIVSLAASSACSARDAHALPDGAGMRDGTSFANALDARAARALLRAGGLKPGDRLLLGSGEYRGLELEIAVSGTEPQPVVIEGRDTGGGLPQLTGAWSEKNPDQGGTAIEIAPGVRDVTVRGLRVSDCVTGMLAPPARGGGARQRLVFEGITMRRVRHGYYLSDCHALRVEDCHLARFTKHGFRLEDGCEDVTLRRCTADCSEGDSGWEKLTESLPFGFFANGSRARNTRLLFQDCVARNHMMPLQKGSYKNGDGFVIEEGSTQVRFLRCRAIRNQDGGFDLKSPGVRLESCVALENSRNFRIWNAGTLENCFTGMAPAGLWSHAGPVTVTRSTFHTLENAASVDDDANAVITLKDCLLSQVRRAFPNNAGGRLILDESSITGGDVRLKQTAPAWQGDSDAMDSTSHPGKGWRWPGPRD
ncbi:MAG TPA: hypothetical protein DIT13_08000 [Verrucomicrobiales bacterium]|nr:hypothetical protein [Verrucomicrobiales bacterium]